MDPIKDAFEKIKKDIHYLHQEIEKIKFILNGIKSQPLQQKNHVQTQNTFRQTDAQHTTLNKTMNLPLEGPKSQDIPISTGNEGVSTDRQTYTQTDRQPPNFHWNPQNQIQNQSPTQLQNQSSTQLQNQTQVKLNNKKQVTEILNSLDELKKEVRLKFKKLTAQEMLVFSSIFELEEQGFIVDYALISERLGLTESSIRDYILRLIKKGIPVIKTRENNKKITLTISEELKKMASLEAIIQLRNL